ncbi:unnamed protein product [Polarella glacialis]|uniref:Poly [ADP-ribose] polymerase n=1 Tax=Polarella glacialis TaxID=89957 RepID=A0A813HJ78_POLGL|nr:unnamed protein product [Polarella glacialis]
MDETLRLWRTADGSLQRQLHGHTDGVVCSGFSPDGSLVVSGSLDRTPRLWRTADGSLQQQLNGHTDLVFCCGFSPDGSLVVSGSRDKTLRLWRTADGSLQRQRNGHATGVSCCSFSPDGSLVVSGSGDKTLRLWLTADGSLQQGVTSQSRKRTRSQGALVGADQQLLEVKGEFREASAELQSAKSLKAEVEQALQKSELQRAWLLAAQLPQPSQYLEYDIVVLPTASPVWRLLSGLFVGSAAKHRRDLRSANFCEAPALEVEQIRSVVNPRLLQSYLAELDSILGKHRGGCTAIPELEHLRLPPGLFRPDLNEHLLFHGALPESVEKICKGGFDPRRGGEGVGAMFGTATYFAINASKSDIYTEEFARRRQRSAQRTMIVARVALGTCLRTGEPQQKWSRPPDGPDGLPFDSVWAANAASGGCVDHVEVMIYDKSQAIPMFLVDYRHTEQCRCAECLKRRINVDTLVTCTPRFGFLDLPPGCHAVAKKEQSERDHQVHVMMNAFESGLYAELALINHSCFPNCLKFGPGERRDGADDGRQRSWCSKSEIVAVRDLRAGEEITISFLGCLERSAKRRAALFRRQHLVELVPCEVSLSAELETSSDALGARDLEELEVWLDSEEAEDAVGKAGSAVQRLKLLLEKEVLVSASLKDEWLKMHSSPSSSRYVMTGIACSVSSCHFSFTNSPSERNVDFAGLALQLQMSGSQKDMQTLASTSLVIGGEKTSFITSVLPFESGLSLVKECSDLVFLKVKLFLKLGKGPALKHLKVVIMGYRLPNGRTAPWVSQRCPMPGANTSQNEELHGSYRSWNFCSYNPQVATFTGRWRRILALLTAVHVMGLQGTHMRPSVFQQAGSAVHTKKYGEFQCWHWHAGEGRYSNSSTGVSIAVNSKQCHSRTLAQVFSPPTWLQGRGGALHFRQRDRLDFVPMTLYLPASGPVADRAHCTISLLEWASSVLASLSGRATPVIFIDANGHVGKQHSGATEILAPEGDAVGPLCPELMTLNGQLLQQFCNQHELALVNTHVGDAGPTFWHWDGHGTRVDYIILPKAALQAVSRCEVWRRTAFRLQLASCPALRDHSPLVVSLTYSGLLVRPPVPRVRWDMDAMARACATGEKVNGLHAAIADWAQQTDVETHLLNCAQEGNVEMAWQMLNSGVRIAAEKVFSLDQRQRKYEPSPCTLQARATLDAVRQQAKAVADHSWLTRPDLALPRLAELLQAWHWAVATQIADRRLGTLRARDRDKCRRHWETELAQAQESGDRHACWVISRLIAGTGLGPKRRYYGGVSAYIPAAQGWVEHLQLPGPQGGCHATVIGLGEEHQQDQLVPALLSHLHALEDIKFPLDATGGGLGEYRSVPADTPLSIRRASLTRQNVLDTNATTLATEDHRVILQQLLKAKSRKSVPRWSAPREAWLLLLCGSRRTHYSGGSPIVQRLLWVFLLALRRAGHCPYIWNTSFAVPLPKLNGKKLCAAFRLINLLEPIGKAWHAGLFQLGEPQLYDWAYGFMKHRRREQAILQQRRLQYRIQQAGYNWFTISWDVANAFPSVAHNALDSVIRERCLQGDRVAPVAFAEAYNAQLTRLDEAIRCHKCIKRRPALRIEDPRTEESLPVAMSVLADDVARTGICTSATDALEQIAVMDAMLDQHLEQIAMGQKPNLEISVRILAARKAWAAMGAFWYRETIPCRVRVQIFMALVRNALLSGLETIVLTAPQWLQLERIQMRYLRALMCSQACVKTQELQSTGQVLIKYHALTNTQVRTSLHVPTLQSEMTSRRVKWLQQMAQQPEQAKLVFALLHGYFLWEQGQPVQPNGKLTSAASPWLVQHAHDVSLVAQSNTTFAADWTQTGWWAIFTSDAFHKFNPQLLKRFDNGSLSGSRCVGIQSDTTHASVGTPCAGQATDRANFRQTRQNPSSRPAVEGEYRIGAADRGGSTDSHGRGKNHELGSRHLHVWAALIQSVAQQQNLPAPLASLLQQHIATATSPQSLQHLVLHCRFTQMRGNTSYKLTVAVAAPIRELWSHLVTHLVTIGVSVMPGTAPRGPHERQIAKLLRKLGAFQSETVEEEQ